MKIIIITIIIMLIFSINVMAINPLLKFIFESAVETDRYQSQYWHFAYNDNPVFYALKKPIQKENQITYMIPYSENNFMVAGTRWKEFNRRVDLGKKAVNYIPELIDNNLLANLIYSAITIVELKTVIDNNREIGMAKNLSQYYILSYSWEF